MQVSFTLHCITLCRPVLLLSGHERASTILYWAAVTQINMLRPLQDRERGLCGPPLAFTKAAYVAALPRMRLEGSLKHHRGCVNHISFSESGMLNSLCILCRDNFTQNFV